MRGFWRFFYLVNLHPTDNGGGGGGSNSDGDDPDEGDDEGGDEDEGEEGDGKSGKGGDDKGGKDGDKKKFVPLDKHRTMRDVLELFVQLTHDPVAQIWVVRYVYPDAVIRAENREKKEKWRALIEKTARA